MLKWRGRPARHPSPPPGLPAPVWATLLREAVDALLARRALVAAAQLLAAFAAIWWTLLTFGDLSEDVAEGETQALDDATLAFLHRHETPALDAAAHVLSLLGSEVVALLLAALLVAFTLRRRWGAALSLLVVTGGAQLLNNVLKDHFQRARPAPVLGLIPAQHWGFPSGHAMVAAAFYLFLAYAAWRGLRGRWRPTAVAALLVLVPLIGWSRLSLGVHFLSDVLAGYCAGAAWAAAVMSAHHLLTTRARIRHAAA